MKAGNHAVVEVVAMRRVAVGVLIVALLGGCGAPVEPASSPPTPNTPDGKVQALPVYYVADTRAGQRLYREFHQVSTIDPASDAVREMFGNAIDPDYRTLWPSGTALRSPVTSAGGVITVDLTGIAGARPVQLALQQLVFTVQGALQSTEPVRILVDGQPITPEPLARGDAYALRSLVQIDAPANGATVDRQVEVTGEAAVFEATVRWELLRDGAVIRSGFTNSAEGQRFAPYRFTLALEPGEYTVRVLEDDPSDGEGRPVLTDDKLITVKA
jgi:hypothetical protein